MWLPLYFIFIFRSQAEGEGAKTGGEADEPQKVPSGEVAEQASQSKSGTINISLANAGHTLGGAEVELVLKPLRLAFETKNLKIFDAALDCLHVCPCFLFSLSIPGCLLH